MTEADEVPVARESAGGRLEGSEEQWPEHSPSAMSLDEPAATVREVAPEEAGQTNLGAMGSRGQTKPTAPASEPVPGRVRPTKPVVGTAPGAVRPTEPAEWTAREEPGAAPGEVREPVETPPGPHPVQLVRDVMSPSPRTLPAASSLQEAARFMRDHDIGPVIVVNDDGGLRGIVTDRDIVVRAVAEGREPTTTRLAEICSEELVVVGPDDDAEAAIRFMRERAVRRLPVVEGERPVGIVAIGDLAVTRDPGSALAEISAAPPNR